MVPEFARSTWTFVGCWKLNRDLSEMITLCVFQLITISLHKKMKFSIKDFFSRCDQILRKLQLWYHLLKKSLMQNFMFCAVYQHCYFEAFVDLWPQRQCLSIKQYKLRYLFHLFLSFAVFLQFSFMIPVELLFFKKKEKLWKG